MPRMETDDKIESREIFGPVHLMVCKNLDSSEVFEIFVISDNVIRLAGTSKIVTPHLEGFEDHEKLFVMNSLS